MIVLVAVFGFQSQLVFAQGATTTNANTGAGYDLNDKNRGFKISVPANWSVNAGKYTISMSHGTHFDAYITLKKSWYTVSTADELYSKVKDNLGRTLPGAEIIKEKEAIKIGNISGLSVTYVDPAQQKVNRSIVFIHRGLPYELKFAIKQKNFKYIKEDFGKIFKGIQPY